MFFFVIGDFILNFTSLFLVVERMAKGKIDISDSQCDYDNTNALGWIKTEII